jgi:hypothetical protein
MLRPQGRGISRHSVQPISIPNRSDMTTKSHPPRPIAPFVLSVCLVLSVVTSAAATDTEWRLQWRVLETPDLRLVYYDEEHSYVLPHLARCFENTMGYYRSFFDYEPSEEVTILLQDFDDYGYAGTSTIPNNYITLGIEPFEYVYETCPTNERFNWVVNHEMVHVVVSEKGAGLDEFYRAMFFGKVTANSDDPWSLIYSYLTNPRRYAPRWYHEGIAVFLETWLAGGIGRALGGYDEMVFRSMVRDSAYFYDVVGLESEGTTIDFQIGQNSYLYGTRFMSYLAYEYSPEQVIEWVNRTPGSKASFSAQFEKTFGRSLDDGWSRWIEWEHRWQTANLDSVRKYPVTPSRQLIGRALGSASRGYYDESTRKLYTAVNYPGEFAHIAAIGVDDGSLEKICRVQTPALYYVSSVAFDEDTGTLFFTTNNGKHWRDLNSVNVRSGEVKELLRNFRTGDLCFNRADKSIWGVQHHNGISSLVRIAPPYNDWNLTAELMTLPFGRDIFDLDVSPDGEYLTCSMIEITGRARLVRLSIPRLMAGDASYQALYEFTKTAPANFVYSRDGRYLYGTAYQTGVSNVFRWDFEREAMEAVTNSETGYFRPCPVSDDSLIVFDYTGHGLRPVMIPDLTIEDIAPVRYLGNAVVEAHPVVKDWKLGSPRDVDLDSVVTYKGGYGKWKNTRVASAYPVVDKYKDWTVIGVRFNLMDPVGLHSAELKAGWTPSRDIPSEERWHAIFKYRSWPWTLTAGWNRSDFYDFFGPTLTSRKGYLVTLQYQNYIVADKPKYLEYDIFLGQFGELDELPFAQGIPATYDQYTTGHAKLEYRNLGRTIGAVDYEKGVKAGALYAGNYVEDTYYSQVAGYGHYGFQTPLEHSSIWLRGYAGYSWGDPDDTFANFYFGGFGNNYVDHRSVPRYREYYAYPGIEISSLAGTNFGKLTLEWLLPPARFERLGFPWVYVTWMRTALFTTGVAASLDDSARRRELVNLGGQLDFRLVWMSGLSMTLSLGYAGAWEQDRRPESEFMISLKIL